MGSDGTAGALARAARAAVASGWEAQSRVRAAGALLDLGERSPVPPAELRGLLEEVAERPPDRARGAAAALPAVALIERLDAPPDDQAEAVWRLFDGRDNGEPVASDEWHPCPSFAELDSGDMLGQRREWYRRLAAERAGEKG